MKRALTILLAFTMILALQSCGTVFKSLVTTTPDRYTFPYENGVGIMEDRQQFASERQEAGDEGIYLERAKGKDKYLWIPAAADISKTIKTATTLDDGGSPEEIQRIYVDFKDLKVHRIKKH